jgi:alpha-D-ribose 1-methylphosphonate 5-triphosphate synthase subunit PhnH
MARPGKLYQLPPVGQLLGSTSGKYSQYETLATVLNTLLDHEVTFCLLGNDDTSFDLTPMLSAITGSRSTTRDKADYVVTLQAPEENLLPHLNPGNLLYPNMATTLISLVEELENELPTKSTSPLLELSGPGIKSVQKLWVAGTNATFFNTLNDINAGYPTGIDIFWLTPAGKLVGLPRSSKITILEG